QVFLEEWTELLGTTQPLPDHVARVSAPLEGRVIALLQAPGGKPVQEGMQVHKGDVLAQLDATIAQANRDKVAAAQEDLKQQIVQADFAVKLAEIELQKLDELSHKNVAGGQSLVAPIELEKARVAVEDARSKKKGAELRQVAGAKELQAL